MTFWFKEQRVRDDLERFAKAKNMNESELSQCFERLLMHRPEIVENAQNVTLLAASVIYSYLRMHNLHGRRGITAKEVGDFFHIKPSAIQQKLFYVYDAMVGASGFWMDGEIELPPAPKREFVDMDRYDAASEYWDFLESGTAEKIDSAIEALREIIKKDPDYLDPYIELYGYLTETGEEKEAIETMKTAYERAIALIGVSKGKGFPAISWLFQENRHIVRALYSYATMLWGRKEKKSALQLYMQLLRSNPDDNIGARYAAAAILDGFESHDEFEDRFSSPDGYGLNVMLLNTWFESVSLRFPKIFEWWHMEMEKRL